MSVMTIDESIEKFPQIIYKHTSKLKNEDSLFEAIERAENIKYDRAGRRYEILRQRKSKVLLALGKKYVAAKLSRYFPILDNKLFDFPRYFKIAINANQWTRRHDVETEIISDQRYPFTKKIIKENNRKIRYLDSNLFAVANIDFSNTAFSAELGRIPYGYRECIYFYADMPGTLTDDLLKGFALAKQRYFEVMSECYKIPKLADIFSLEANDTWQNEEDGRIRVMWIPQTKTIYSRKISIPNSVIDPAMILTVAEHNFLIKMWNVEGEEPFEHLIREFSLGELPRITDEEED